MIMTHLDPLGHMTLSITWP